MEDRKKIEELMSIAKPLEQDIVLRKDIRPGNYHYNFTNFTRCQAKVCSKQYSN